MEFESRSLTAGCLDDLVIRLGKKEGVERFMDRKVVLAPPGILTHPVFKTVALGVNTKTPRGMRRLLKNAHVGLDEYATAFLRSNKFAVSQARLNLDTVVLNPNDLGVHGTPMTRDWKAVLERAFSLGFTRCPADLGPQLRLQYLDQPKGERLIIVMDSFPGASYVPAFFHLLHDDNGLQLVGGNGNTNFCSYDEERFVLVRPRNLASS